MGETPAPGSSSRAGRSSRRTAIEEFAEFARSESHVLTRWPELAFQQAANTAEADAVAAQRAPARAAVYRQLTGLQSRPWLRRLNPAPAARACLVTLAGHRGSALRARVDAAGGRIVSTGIDGTLRIWSARTGDPVAVVAEAVEGRSGALALLPASKAAVAAPGGRIGLWDCALVEQVGELDGPAGGVSFLAVDGAGRWLAIGSSTGVRVDGGDAPTLVLYDLAEGAHRDIGDVTLLLSAVALDPDVRFVLCAAGSVVHVVDAEARRIAHAFTAEGENVSCVAVSRDGTVAATGSWGGAIELWEVDAWSRRRRLWGFQGIVQDLAFSPDGRELATAGLDGTIAVWDAASGECLTILRGHDGLVSSVEFTSDGAGLVSASVDGTVRVWDPQSDRDFFRAARGELAGTLGTSEGDQGARALEYALYAMSGVRKHSMSVTGLAFTADGRRLVTAGLDDTVRIWSLETGSAESVLEGHEHGVSALAMSADGRRVATGDRASTLKLWDVPGGREIASRRLGVDEPGEADYGGSLLGGLAREIQRPAFSSLVFVMDDRILLSAAVRDPSIEAWDAVSLEPRFRLEGHAGGVIALATASGDRRLVSAGDDGTVLVWDLEERRREADATGYRTAPRRWGQAGGLSVLGDRIACAWSDGTVKILDLGTLREAATLGEPGEAIVSVGASDDGALLALARGETRIEVWRPATGELVWSRDFPSADVTFAWERGGRRLAVGGPAEPLAVWDVESGTRLARYPDEVTGVVFHGNRIAAANDLGDVFLLELTVG